MSQRTRSRARQAPLPMPDSSPTILLVDDEDSVRKVLAFPLERDGYDVVQAADGEEALHKFDAQPVDLVVLDIMLPRLDGLEVCKRLRAKSTVPIIMLTARDDELDKVIGLELGADDYITKPFSIREFRSRVRALLRRARAPHAPEDGVEERIEHDGLVIDIPRRAVEVRGEPVQLTYVEFELLRALAAQPGRVFSRRMLLEALWKSATSRVAWIACMKPTVAALWLRGGRAGRRLSEARRSDRQAEQRDRQATVA